MYRILTGLDLFASQQEAWDQLQNVDVQEFLREKLVLVERRNESAARLLGDMLALHPKQRPTANSVQGRPVWRGGSTINVYSKMKSAFTKIEEKVDSATEAVKKISCHVLVVQQ